MQTHPQSEASVQSPAGLVVGKHSRRILLRLRLNILRLALSAYRNPITAARVLKALIRKRMSILGVDQNHRLAYAGGRYFQTPGFPGWPSEAFNRFVTNECNKIIACRPGEQALQTMIFSITSRCPLRCDHCYEWNNLATEEYLTPKNLQVILAKFQAYGVTNIQFSGGEPLSRYNTLLQLLRTAGGGTDFWILTSGFGLTPEKAVELQASGLTGVMISLDHWDAANHNAFRHHSESYDWALQAARNASRAGMVTAFSLCARREFVSQSNLMKYLQLASANGASMVRILEPRQVGHFAGQSIVLEQPQLDILRDFYLQSLSDPAFHDLPLLEYVGYHQRIHGCFGAGDRYLYVDSQGDIHACPFCQGKAGNALTDFLPDAIARLRQTGCHKFHSPLMKGGS